MYTFNIEPSDNKNTDTNNKIVGGGAVFKVYKVSDFVLIDVGALDMDQLCEYFFGYIVYDKLVDDGKKMYYELQKKLGELEDSIIGKLNNNVNENGAIVNTINDIHTFSEHISSLFSVTSAGSASQPVDINRAKWEDVSSKINLSQGQYLHHLDSVYKKYESIYHNEQDDYKLKKILDLRDTTFRRPGGGTFHQKIELKYTELESIKSSNFFYKTEHFYIQDKNMLKQKFTTKEAIQTLLQKHGIEKLIHIYYTYLSIKDLKELYEFRFNIRKAIAHFMCDHNFDIVNLLIFQDILFYKIIKNGASIIYNTDGRVDPVSKPLLRDTLKVEDNTRDDNINEQFLKHQLFYRYKELEKALRRYYLPHVVFDISLEKKPQHSAIDIIQIRQTTLEDDVCLLDTEGEIIIDKMKSVTTFYKPEPNPASEPYQPCQLVKYMYRDSNLEESHEGSMDTYCIGKIIHVRYETKQCTIQLLTIIENNDTFDTDIDKLSLQSNSNSLDITSNFFDLFKTYEEKKKLIKSIDSFFMPDISFDFIYDTSLLFGVSSKQCGFTGTVKITYRDFDLFNQEFDRQVTYVSLVYNIEQDDNNVLFIIPESVQNSRPENKALAAANVEPVESEYAYITFDIDTNKKLINPSCNTITECEIAEIFKKNEEHLSDTYHDASKFCILIEKISADKNNIEKIGWSQMEQLDKLYFSTNQINL